MAVILPWKDGVEDRATGPTPTASGLVRGVVRAILPGKDEQALGAVELFRSPLPDGKGVHAQSFR